MSTAAPATGLTLRTRLALLAALPTLLLLIVALIGSRLIVVSSLPADLSGAITFLVALAGLGALVLSALIFRHGRTLVAQMDRLRALADQAAASPKPTRSVAEAVGNMAEMARRHEELTKAYQDLEASNRQIHDLAETLRKTEARTAEHLQRLRRAEDLAHHRTRAALIGDMFAGVASEVAEVLQTVQKAPADAIPAPVRQALLGLQQRLRLYTGLAGARAHKPEVVKLKDVMDEALLASDPKWKSEAFAAGLTFHVKCECAEDLMVRADRTQLLEIFMHLLMNAVEAMPLGGLITILAGRLGSGSIMVTLKDEGQGMSDDVLHACREPFFSTKENAPGAGLAIVTALAQQNNIRFGLRSEKGRGTSALLEFPDARVGQSFQLREQPAAPARPMLVLVIEDNPTAAELLADMLHPDGHVVDICTAPLEAAARLEKQAYDVILTDLAMPGCTGIEIARIAKQRRPDLPVIMITGFASTLKDEDYPKGVDAVLGKPCSARELRATLARVTLNRRGMSAPPPATPKP